MEWPELARQVEESPDLLVELVQKAHDIKGEESKALHPALREDVAKREWEKDRALMRFLHTWEQDLDTESVAAVRWI
jgi:hypothetical protein